MLSAFRKFAGTWPARIFFLVLVASFASWGIADVVRKIGTGSGAVASVLGHDITPADFMREYNLSMRRYAEQLPDPTQIPPELKKRVAAQVLQRLVTQEALAQQIAALDLTVPDSQLRDNVFAMTDFQGPDGKFSRALLLQVLSSNHMTESQFLDLVRKDIAQNQLLGAIGAAAGPSDMLTAMVYRYLNETRQADIARFPFAGQPLPPAPADSVLRRAYKNNPARYTAPEYRHVKVVVLSPDSIGRTLDVSEAEMQAWFTQHKKEYVTPEKRSLQVITAGSMPVAATLAARWKSGMSWEAIQAAAKAAGATGVELADATPQEVPSPELAKAAFAAEGGAVIGPIAEPLGAQILRVTRITAAKNPSFESLHAEIRQKLAAEKALDLIDARAQKLQDAFAGGAKIDEVPADLGATGASGTLDAKGNTTDGTPAPLPLPATLRQTVIDAAFRTNPGDPVQALEGGDHVWYAIAVDSITRPALRPFDQVAAQVLADWQAEQVRHLQEAAAAGLLTHVQAGQTLPNAVWGTGIAVTRTPPLKRDRPQDDLTAELVHTLFTLPQGGSTMVETAKGYIVAQVAAILQADPKSDDEGLRQTRQGLTRALRDDYQVVYAGALRDGAHPSVHPETMQALLNQPGE